MLCVAFSGELLAQGLAMHGEPALPPDFAAFPYAEPAAPKGGRLRLGVQGTFDGFNPMIVKGVTAVQAVTGLVVEPLMRRSLDEPFTLYPLIAESVTVPDDRSWATFRLDPRARFSDGSPITSADIRFSFDLLRTRGRPNYRNSYDKVAKVETPDDRTIRFDLAGANDRELPLILGLMPVLARHATDAATFETSSFAPPLGSGPYLVSAFEPGSTATFRRREDYWAADLPSNRGSFNFAEIRFDYYRDSNTLFEAFKAGLIDLRVETDPTRWREGYDIPRVRDGRIRRETLPERMPAGMAGFVFNARRPPLDDVRVREALGFVFDFEWLNRTYFGGAYRRTTSYFEGTELASSGIPARAREQQFLARFPGAVRDDVLQGRWMPPRSDGSGRDRGHAGLAMARLAEAGFTKQGGIVRHDATGRPLDLELIVPSREQERVALAFARSLGRLGVGLRVRLLDDVQYERRRQNFDFEVMIASWPVSPSPGNEQFFRWGSAAAGREGSFNFAGVRSPAVDAAIEALVAARAREEFVAAGRVLDRLLLSGFYVVPLYHAAEQRLAYDSALRHPPKLPLLGIAYELWWRAAPP
jgi:peptide/nickel transport system substrate-binding protein